MSGNKLTLRRLTDTQPSTITISDIIKMNTGFLRASRVSHIAFEFRVQRTCGCADVEAAGVAADC